MHFSTFKSPRDHIWPWQKIAQGQPRVTIWTNSVVLCHLMVHTKYQGNQTSGSGDEDFLRFLPYMGIVAIWAMRPGPFEYIFKLPLPGWCTWNLIEIGPAVSEEKSFENVNTFNPSDLWPRTLNALGLWYSQRWMKHSLSYHRVPLFWKNTMFHLFSIQTSRGPNLTLKKNRSRPT